MDHFDYQIRKMTLGDLPAVLEMERDSFQNPWSEDDLKRMIQWRRCAGLLVKCNATPVGYMLSDNEEDRIHLLRIVTAPLWRRRGVAQHVLKRLVENLAACEHRRITVEIDESNLPALNLFRKLGFRAVEIRKGHYDDAPDDAYFMEYVLVEDDPWE